MLNLKRVYNFVSAMKTGVVLLALIGIISAIGTVISPNTFFHTIIFKFLLLLLFINMGFCTFNQISRFIKIIKKAPGTNRFWVRQASLLVLHLGIVLILVGGIINAYQGQSTQVRIIEGNTVNIADIINTNKPFALKVNNFKIDFYEDGSPSQYISQVTIIDRNNSNNYAISVNHPLNHHGIKAYQHSYGYVVNIESNNLKDKENKRIGEGEIIEFADTDRTINLYKYIPNYDMRYGMNSKTARPDNPKIIYSLNEHGHMLGIGLADFGEEVVVDENIFLTFTNVTPYTVLTIKSDPGLLIAGIGGIMLMLGICWFWLLTSRQKSKPKNMVNGGIDSGND